jgi:hypothetical protein
MMMVLAVGREVCPASGGVGEGVDRNLRPLTSRAIHPRNITSSNNC